MLKSKNVKEKSLLWFSISLNFLKACLWTQDDFDCVSEDSDEAAEITDWEAPVDYETETCPRLFDHDSGPVDEYPAGTWKCRLGRDQLTVENHNVAGARCQIHCEPGLEVIDDGEKRRCRWKEKNGGLEWSGTVDKF
jgi:hypothetical protein